MKMIRPARALRLQALRPWRRLSPTSRRLITTGAVLLLAMVVLVSLAMINMRHVALHNARQDEEDLGLAIAEQTSRSVQAIDLVLQETQKEIASQGITTPDAFEAALNTEAVHKALHQEGSGLPQAQFFSILNADGRLINTSAQWPVPPLNLTDRDYYKYLKNHDDQTLYLTNPLRNRRNNVWTVFAIRRVDSPSGQFLGLLLGAINLDYFVDFYRSLVTDNGLTVTLLNRDGDIIASYPELPRMGHTLMPPRPPYNQWQTIVASGRPGAYEALGILSPGMRLNEVNPLQDYPLVVSVGVSKAAVLANWRKESSIAAGGTLIAILCVFLVLRALALQLQRLETSEASLAEQNEALVKVKSDISFLANHDDLTGLTNRRAFHQQLNQAIADADRDRHGLAVLYLDLDRFKIANDTRGHDFGDLLLVQLAARLRQLIDATDIVARTGGDEFAILRPMIDHCETAPMLAQALLEGIRRPFEIEGMQCRIGCSIGIACYPAHGANGGELLRNADIALYQAKAGGGDLWCTFDESMNARQQEVYILEQGLRQALELRQFELNYQSIVEIPSGEIVACEALLRWRHPERGLIPPADFIGLAESLGLIVPIGYWVFETACAEAAAWPAPLTIAVNLSPIQFRDENLFEKIQEILKRTGLSPRRLTLEITEGVLLEDSSRVFGIMERLRGLGVRLSLDDFGTGHSGLGYLRQFPLEGIKIDKLFVHDVEHQPQARSIVIGLLMIASALKLSVVAEGIENEAQMTILHQLGCRLGQGYFTGRPEPSSSIRERLSAMVREQSGARHS